MRKPSDLKMYVNNQIKYLAEEVHKINLKESTGLNEYNKAKMELAKLNAKLDVLFDIQKICEDRKKY